MAADPNVVDAEYTEENPPPRGPMSRAARPERNLNWLWSALIALIAGLIVGYLLGNFGAVSLVDFKASQVDLKACLEASAESAKEFGAFKANAEQALASVREEKSRLDVALAKCQADLACCEKSKVEKPKTKKPPSASTKAPPLPTKEASQRFEKQPGSCGSGGCPPPARTITGAARFEMAPGCR